jgi:hypothetical protein
MNTRYFALIIGIIYLIVGIAGFIPALRTAPPAHAPDVIVHASHGYLLGLFPVNTPHNIVHLIIGVWGITAYGAWNQARVFARSLAILYGILAVMGLFPVLNTVFGLIPLHGHDVWLHAITAIIAAYFGWAVVERPVAYGTMGN